MAINRVTLMGNLTRDGVLRTSGEGKSVLSFGLAVNERYRDKKTGKAVESTVFVDCAMFGTGAEKLAPYLTKGRKVTVDGRLRYRTWMKDDEKRSALSIAVTDLGFADYREPSGGDGDDAAPELYDADIPF